MLSVAILREDLLEALVAVAPIGRATPPERYDYLPWAARHALQQLGDLLRQRARSAVWIWFVLREVLDQVRPVLRVVLPRTVLPFAQLLLDCDKACAG